MSPLWLSVQVAFTALLAIILVGLTIIYLLKRYAFRGKSLVDSLLTLPLVLPPVVVGFALLIIFSPAYSFGSWLGHNGITVVFSRTGAVIASAVIAFPLFYQTVRAALDSVDPAIEDVARTLGASELRIFITISLPLAWRGVLAGSMLAFSRALGEFGATILIAGNIPGVTRTMPLAIYSSVEAGNYDAALTFVLYICTLTLSLLWSVHLLTQGDLF